MTIALGYTTSRFIWKSLTQDLSQSSSKNFHANTRAVFSSPEVFLSQSTSWAAFAANVISCSLSETFLLQSNKLILINKYLRFGSTKSKFFHSFSEKKNFINAFEMIGSLNFHFSSLRHLETYLTCQKTSCHYPLNPCSLKNKAYKYQ